MKCSIEVIDSGQPEEILIRCHRVDGRIERLRRIIDESENASELTFYKQDEAYYFPLDDVLFFDTGGEYVYAHTRDDMYRVRYRLYELEKILPRYFVRVAKATILNVRHVYSVQRSVTASSLIQFQHSHKQVFASRYYYKGLRQRLEERGKEI